MNLSIEILGWPQIFSSERGDRCPISPGTVSASPSLLWLDGQLLLPRDQAVVAACLLPSLLPSPSARMCALGTRNLLTFLHAQDQVWTVICSFSVGEESLS